LIEDNPGDARLIKEFLGETGKVFELDWVDSLSKGLKRLNGKDAVLLDLALPDSTGLDTFEKIHLEAPDLPIIVLTGNDDDTLSSLALQEGAQDYLVKGQVSGQILARSIRYAIERNRIDKELKSEIIKHKKLEADLMIAKEAAEEAARAKAEFLANMSHEIRTPMNAVIGMTGLLLDSNLEGEQQECVEIIRSSGDALLAIINDILDFSKIEAGRMGLEKKTIRFQKFLEDCLDLLAARAREKGITLHYEIHENVPDSINSDPTRLRQILINLLSNAVKFTEKGEVMVSVSSIASGSGNEGNSIRLQFAVQDTGIGIPPEKMNRLFQSFSQVDMSTSRKYGGTGLGLAISRKLVDLMGGRIWVESEVGKGSTFFFSVPVDIASPMDSKEASSSYRYPHLRQAPGCTRPDAPQADHEELRILIAEDNDVNKRVIEKMLRKLGFVADVAKDGLDVLAALERQRYDLILMDIQMPHMDGLEAASLIRKRWPLAKQPCIIALTACALDGDRDRCLDAGMDGYISKPVKMGDLREALRKFEMRRARRDADLRLLSG
jgi:signal transduction histidine kinase